MSEDSARDAALWRQVEQQRRYRMYYLDYGQAVLLLNACRIVDDLYVQLIRLEQIPDDARVVAVDVDPCRRALAVTVSHPSFEPVPPFEPIPEDGSLNTRVAAVLITPSDVRIGNGGRPFGWLNRKTTEELNAAPGDS